MVEVFRQVRRVLRDDGTLWLNLGDSYVSVSGGQHQGENGQMADRSVVKARSQVKDSNATRALPEAAQTRPFSVYGLAPKNLVGIPWRVAFALQADGWYLRSDIIWSKPNPMPESVTDRPTKSHEFLFLLTKAPWKGREPGPIERRLSTEDARWLALLLDAEGNIAVKRVAPQGENAPQYAAQIAVGSTSRALLQRAADLVGAGNILERKGTNAPMFYWQVSNKVAQDLLYALYPHLIVKQRQAAIAIHLESLLYHRGNATRRTDSENATLESLWLRNKACNQFGDPDLSDVPAPKYGKWGETRYWFDQEAVREGYKYDGRKVLERENGPGTHPQHRNGKRSRWPGISQAQAQARREVREGGHDESDPMEIVHGGRNVRSVWEIATQPYAEAHFATYPQELVRRCLLAGCPEWVCGTCGKPRERIVERPPSPFSDTRTPGAHTPTSAAKPSGSKMQAWLDANPPQTTGWSDCGHDNYQPGTVLDPFLGSGTTALVARNHSRRSIGIELNQEYCELAARRLAQQSLLAGEAA